MSAITIVNVKQQFAPAPNKLQQTGAFISVGGTTLPAGSTQLLTNISDLTSILEPSSPIQSIAWAGGTVTVTSVGALPINLLAGDTVNLYITGTIASVLPGGYNGYQTCRVVDNFHFTYPLLTNPGVATTSGQWTLSSTVELQQMNNTHFSQGNYTPVYVLELGSSGSDATAINDLVTWINSSPPMFYVYLCPRTWGIGTGLTDAMTVLGADFSDPDDRTYFILTTDVNNYQNLSATNKCFIAFIEAPGVAQANLIAPVEFSAAVMMYNILNTAPSTVNRVPPFSFRFVYGVTPYPTLGNQTLLQQIEDQYVNVIGTGAEGGISDLIILYGKTLDGYDFEYWYSVDWVSINIDLNISNAVINGSNNPINPLYYNQAGINRLQAVAASTMVTGVQYGLVLGSVVQTAYDQATFVAALDAGTFTNSAVVNAIPFIPYSLANPSDYKQGIYKGFTIIYTPQLGFTQIVFNVLVEDFVAVGQG
jgi:hypothetical protein